MKKKKRVTNPKMVKTLHFIIDDQGTGRYEPLTDRWDVQEDAFWFAVQFIQRPSQAAWDRAELEIKMSDEQLAFLLIDSEPKDARMMRRIQKRRQQTFREFESLVSSNFAEPIVI